MRTSAVRLVLLKDCKVSCKKMKMFVSDVAPCPSFRRTNNDSHSRYALAVAAVSDIGDPVFASPSFHLNIFSESAASEEVPKAALAAMVSGDERKYMNWRRMSGVSLMDRLVPIPSDPRNSSINVG